MLINQNNRHPVAESFAPQRIRIHVDVVEMKGYILLDALRNSAHDLTKMASASRIDRDGR
jgi:hypothetical protein